MLNDVIFQTDRLKIIAPTMKSLDNWYKLQSDADVMRYIGDGKPRDEDGAKASLQKSINHYEKYGFSLFDIYEKNSNEFIGEAGLIYIAFDEDNQDVEVGYTLHKKYWNKGYATELAKAFINLGFTKFHLDRIVACCESENIASSNVMKKCGMRYNGKYLYNGKHECDRYIVHNVVIETNNFYLRPFHKEDDFKLCYNLWNDKNVLESMECKALKKIDIEDKLSRYKAWMDKFGFTNFAVFAKGSDDFVGSCGISLFHDPENDRNPLPAINLERYFNNDVELGYVLYKKYWGKGYATELAKACVDFIFNNYPDIQRIVAVTFLNNTKSQNVLSKLGFEFIKDVKSLKYGKEKFYVTYGKEDAPIILSEYDAEWPLKFKKEKDFLMSVIGKWVCGSIEHIGSTSVPGLTAKPVIDIMFGVKSLESSKAAIELLVQNGYNYFPYKKEVMHWFCKPSPNLRTHHLHLIPYESNLWKERVKFRDILRANAEIANQYVELKKELAICYKEDREMYTEKKWNFIQKVLSDALAIHKNR
ncbi:MAG: RimJ/RimL family protein N-acetyltransferase [Candidatus Midichloriaceae bacterium]|jgi:RimJ/RimL family protein N-acetyltransferase